MNEISLENWEVLRIIVKSLTSEGYRLLCLTVDNQTNLDNLHKLGNEQIILFAGQSWLNDFKQKLFMFKNYIWIIYTTSNTKSLNIDSDNMDDVYFVKDPSTYNTYFEELSGNNSLDFNDDGKLLTLANLLFMISGSDGFHKEITSHSCLLRRENNYLTLKLNEIMRNILISSEKVEIWNRFNKTFQLVMTVNKNFTLYSSASIEKYFETKSISSKKYSFQNKTLSICALEYIPFLKIINKSRSFNMDNISGFLVKIIKHLSLKLEFLPDVYQPHDGQYGVKIENKTIYTGCVGEVQVKNASFAAGCFTFNEERNQVVDYSYPLMTDPQIVIYKNPLPKVHWWNPFLSFKAPVWILTFLSMFLIGIITTLFCKFTPFSAWNLKLNFCIKDEIMFAEHIWTSIGTFFMQGQDFYAYPISSRMVTASWWIVSAILLAVYSADLTSLLTLNNGPTMPDTLEGIAGSDEIILHLTIGYASSANIKKSQDAVIQKMYAKSIFVPDCLALLTNPESENVACISDLSPSRYTKLLNCSKYTIVSEIIETTFTGFLIPKLSDFKEAIDREIQMLSDTGVILKWFLEDLKIENDTCDIKTDFTTMPINFDESAGIFIATLTVYGFGLFLLLLEIGFINIFKVKL